MALDTRIALAIKPPEIDDPAVAYSRALTNRRGEQILSEGALDLEAKQAKAQQDREQRMKAARVSQIMAQAPTPYEGAKRLEQEYPDAADKIKGELADHALRMVHGVSNYQAMASAWPAIQRYVGQETPMPQFQSQDEFNQWKREQALSHVDAKTYLEQTKPSAQQNKTREVTIANPDGSTTIKIVKDEPDQEFTSAPKQSTPSAGSDYNQFLTRYATARGKNVADLTDVEELDAKKRWGQADDKATSFAQGDVTVVTPAAVDLAALNYRKTGIMPPLGMGDKSTRQKILNRAASLTPDDIQKIESGGTDIAGNKADYKANADTLTQLTKQRAAIGAFEQTAQKNIDVFLNQAEKIMDTGIPLLNTPTRWISGSGGSSDQAAYQAARLVAINEIAKITSNPTLAGTLSDSARHEVEAFNPQNATLAQTKAVMTLLKQDMQNRTDALDKAIADVRTRIGGGKNATSQQKTGEDQHNGPTLTYQDYLNRNKGRK